MVAYGIATSFQVLSNLSNTTFITIGENGVEEMEQETRRKDEQIASLFDGGRLPPKKLTVTYLMEVMYILYIL